MPLRTQPKYHIPDEIAFTKNTYTVNSTATQTHRIHFDNVMSLHSIAEMPLIYSFKSYRFILQIPELYPHVLYARQTSNWRRPSLRKKSKASLKGPA